MSLKKYIYELGLRDKMTASVKKIAGAFDRTKMEVDLMKRSVSGAMGQVTRFADKVLSLRNIVAGSFAIQAVSNFGGELINTTSKFEKFEAIMANTLGSKSAAIAQMKNLKELTAQMPNQIDEVINGFVKLANSGFKPTNAEIIKMGDLAAVSTGTLDDLVEANLDARTGEFERLKAFGIRSSKMGDTVAFTFKGVTTQVDFTDDAINNYILSLGELEGIQGSMASIMATTGGKTSNLRDKITNLKLELATQFLPVIHSVIDAASAWVDRFRNLFTWISQNSESIGRLGQAIAATTGAYFAMWAAVKTLSGVRAIVLGIHSAFMLYRKGILLTTIAMKVFNFVTKMNPIGLLINGIALGIGALTAFSDRFRDFITGIFPGFVKGIKKIWDTIRNFFGRLFNLKKSKDKAEAGGEFIDPGNDFEDPRAIPQLTTTSPLGSIPKIPTTTTTAPKPTSLTVPTAGAGGAGKNITINVKSLIENVTFQTTNIKTSVEEAKDLLNQALLGMLNDISLQQ